MKQNSKQYGVRSFFVMAAFVSASAFAQIPQNLQQKAQALQERVQVAQDKTDAMLEKAGVQKGDKIVAVNGKKVKSREEAKAILATVKQEKGVVIEVDRNGKLEKLNYKIK